jgi:hypothetical protein
MVASNRNCAAAWDSQALLLYLWSQWQQHQTAAVSWPGRVWVLQMQNNARRVRAAAALGGFGRRAGP